MKSYTSLPQPTASPKVQAPFSRRENWRSAISTIGIVIAAPLIALVLISFVFQSYEVEGPSMETTLQNHDRLIVLKLPKTLARITGKSYIPHRGDVIIFARNEVLSDGRSVNKQLIKRVIGLPDDRVVVNGGVITVYNTQYPEGFNPDMGKGYAQTTSGNVDITVRKDEVFVCGDNRPNSLDSRAFGSVAAKDIVGKLSLRVLPLSNARKF